MPLHPSQQAQPILPTNPCHVPLPRLRRGRLRETLEKWAISQDTPDAA